MLLVSGDAERRLRGRSPAGSGPGGSSDATFPWQDARRRHSESRQPSHLSPRPPSCHALAGRRRLRPHLPQGEGSSSISHIFCDRAVALILFAPPALSGLI